MGPQRFRRGDQNAAQQFDISNLMLQWGRSVSAAEITLGSPRRARPAALQWGRSVSAAEIERLHREAQERALASMGPQRFRRGDSMSLARRSSGTTASMGPQRFRRGDSFHARSSRGRRGRFNGAAAFPPRRCVRSFVSGKCKHSFNGAAAFPPRR